MSGQTRECSFESSVQKSMRAVLFLSACILIFPASATAQSDIDAQISVLNLSLKKDFDAGKYDQALVAANKLVDLYTQKFGKNHVAAANALKNRGFVENAKGDVKQAGNTLEDALDIYKKQPELNKADQLNFISVYESLASIKMQVSTASGERYLTEALRLREKAGDFDSSQLAATIVGLANIKYWARDYIAASDMYKRALLIMAKRTTDLTDDKRAAIHARTKCAYRKAKIEDQFIEVDEEYDNIIEHLPPTVKRLQQVQGGVLNGKAIYLAKPSYPEEARRVGASGTVRVEVLINEGGTIVSACALPRSEKTLIESSEDAALNSKFSPTLLGGQPVKVAGVIVYNFVK